LEIIQLGRRQWQFRFRNGTVTSIFPHNGEWLAPVTLTAEKPVTKFVINRLLPGTLLLQTFDNLLLRLGGREAVQHTGIPCESLPGKTFERFGAAWGFPSQTQCGFR